MLTDSIGRTAGLYSLRTDEVAAFLVYKGSAEPRWEPDVRTLREWLRREFSGLGAPVDRLLELCPEHPYDDVLAQIVMPSWHKGRVALVVDACGAVSSWRERAAPS